MQSFFVRTTKTLIRLRACAGWFDSSLGAHVRRYYFSPPGSVVIVCKKWNLCYMNTCMHSLERSGWHLCSLIRLHMNSVFTEIHAPIKSLKVDTLVTRNNLTFGSEKIQSTLLIPTLDTITKTRLFKYIEDFITRNWKFLYKNSDIFHISAQKHRLWVLVRTASSRDTNNKVYPCKPPFYYIKVGFKRAKIM